MSMLVMNGDLFLQMYDLASLAEPLVFSLVSHSRSKLH